MKRENQQKGKRLSRTYGWLLFSLLLVGITVWDQISDNPDYIHVSRTSMTMAAEEKAPERGRESIETNDSEAMSDPEEAGLIPVYLVGAVRHPGIYHVEPGIYLFQLVELAGGLSADAAAENINLVATVTENQLIRLPTKAEVTAGYAFDLPDTGDTANRLVDLNRADQAALESLPGVGPATARAIIAFREENGPFARIEDLMQVPGIKEARFIALKDLVMTSHP